jgi:diadenosine tetraphosphate (Ap4A) HIT family hydrolase
MTDCAFCTLPEVKERTIAQTDFAWAFLTNIPITPGHLLICPIRHAETFEELTAQEKEEIFALATKMKLALKELFGAEGFHHAWNEGKVAGQSVPHFHLHLVPRKQGDEGITEYEPRKFLYRPGSREATPEKELQAVAKQIKNQLNS